MKSNVPQPKSEEYHKVGKKFFVLVNGIVPETRFAHTGGVSGTMGGFKLENTGFYFIGTESELDGILKAEWDEYKHSRFKVLGIYEADDNIIRLTRDDLTEKAKSLPLDKITLFHFNPEKINSQTIKRATEITFEDTNGQRKELKAKPVLAITNCQHAEIGENDTEWFCKGECGKKWSKELYH